LLHDAKLPSVFNARKATRIQIPVVTTVELFKIETTASFSSTKTDANTKIVTEKC
jgi:hypothetical protein